MALDACEWDQESYCSSYSSSKEATIRTIQRICRTMATPGDESVKEQRSETEKAGQSGGPGDGGMIRVEELQATVEALVQKALESAGTQPKAPSDDDGKLHEYIYFTSILSQGYLYREMTRALHAGSPPLTSVGARIEQNGRGSTAPPLPSSTRRSVI